MIVTSATIEMAQSDVEAAIREMLPDGYRIRHLHLTPKGATATVSTPWVTADLTVQLTEQEAQGRFRWRVQVNKWIPIPGAVVSAILRGITAQAPLGIKAEGEYLILDLSALLAPQIVAKAYDLSLAAGALRLHAQEIDITQAVSAGQGQGQAATDGIA